VTLTAIAYNSSGTDPVRVIARGVTVANGAGTGKSIPWSDDFNAYTGSTPNDLLGLWNLREDAMGMNIRLHNEPRPAGPPTRSCRRPAPDQWLTPNSEDPNMGSTRARTTTG
jgi:hypothetical protein